MNKTLLSLCLFLCSPLSFFAQNIVVKPYLQDVEPTSLFIMWETDNSGAGEIEWGVDPFNLNQTFTSTSTSGSGNSRIHQVQLSGLNAATKYYYRVKMQNGQTSYVYNCKTLALQNAESATRLVAMSDMQRDGGNPNKFQEIVEDGVVDFLLNNYTGDISELIDALLIPGDLVPTGGFYSEWEDYFFNQADSLTPYTPIYPVLGNHEYFLGGEDNFKKYFQLPTNGTSAKEDEWWFKDISNIRIIGLNSNSGSSDQTTQLIWLQSVLDNACIDNDIDFVFAELHHPYLSELWTPGENSFTGDVIEKLEDFSTNCGKPSIHFFGHTHSYSRGQSRDHAHLWVNVATAGGNIDYWGEFSNQDYPEFVKSQDEYGFVVVNIEAGANPSFALKRYGRGDEFSTQDNVLRDAIEVRRYEVAPLKPIPLYPIDSVVNPICLTLKANAFYDAENDTHQASYWQISTSPTDFVNSLIYESWQQNENWYNEVNTQANDDLTDEFVTTNLLENQTYYWRVRYRDAHLAWSEWSEISTFSTTTLSMTNISPFLLVNNGAESGTTNWTGQIESLSSLECGSVPVYAGSRMFAVGGVCNNESSYGMAYQNIDVSTYANQIDNGGIFAKLNGYLRDYSNDDIPSIKMEFFDTNGTSLGESSSISNATTTWTLVEQSIEIPSSTRSIQVILEGVRNAGNDNDSYFDQLQLILQEGTPCSQYDPCPLNLTLNNLMTDGALTTQATETILSTATITGTAILAYQAGTSITLDPGFCTTTGIVFEALIEVCVE